MAVLLILAGTVGWALLHTNLRVIGKNVRIVPATERAAEFARLKEAVKNQSLLGTQLKSGELGQAGEYYFYSYTLRLKNEGLVTAEMIEVQIAPGAGDVLFYGDTAETVIHPGETEDVWCVLLTREKANPVRDLYVTYYLWGHPQEVKYTYDGGAS